MRKRNYLNMKIIQGLKPKICINDPLWSLEVKNPPFNLKHILLGVRKALSQRVSYLLNESMQVTFVRMLRKFKERIKLMHFKDKRHQELYLSQNILLFNFQLRLVLGKLLKIWWLVPSKGSHRLKIISRVLFKEGA